MSPAHGSGGGARRYFRACSALPIRLFLAAALALSAASAARAAVITGTVSNKSTQRFLERAVVRVTDSPVSALTARDGTFRLAGLPAGTYTITADYTGLDQATQTITVTADENATASFELSSDVYELNKLTVTGALEGNAFAVNQQRRAPSTRTITSIDAFVDQSTGNPGEFLKNVEGIQMDYSQNEPQTIRVRGFDPFLTTVLIDGIEVASAASSSANRAVQVDQLSIAAIGSVEVYKAPIPSISANAIGGVVNFISKSAFDQKGRRAFAQVGVNMDSNDFSFKKTPGPGHGEPAERRIYPAGRLEYSDSYFQGRLGVLVSTGIDFTNQLGSSTFQALNVTPLPGGTLPTAPTAYTEQNTVIRRGTLNYAPNRQRRERWDFSVNTDYKLTDSIVLFLKTTYSDYHSNNRNHQLNLTPGTLINDSITQYTTTNGVATQSISVFDKYTKSWDLIPGLRFHQGDWKVDLLGGFSKSQNHYRNDHDFGALSTTLPGLGWTTATPRDTEVPTSFVQNSGPDLYDLNNYAPSQGNLLANGGEHRANDNGLVANNKRDTIDVKYTGKADVQRSFQTRFPFYVKAGVSYNETIFDKHQDQHRWYWMGQDGVASADDLTAAGAQLGRFAEAIPVTQGLAGFNLREPTYFDANKFWNYWQANPQVLQLNTAYDAQQKIVGRQKANEQVRAYYVMGEVTIDKLNILTGMRVEETDLRVEGYRILPTTGATSVLPAGVNANSLAGILASYKPLVGQTNYRSDPFPYLHLRYDWTPNLLTRAAYTEAIGRPNLSDVIPGGISQDDIGRTITANSRAGLLPQRSKNLDFSIEYYTKTSGMFTAGWFSRDVDDYISSTTVPMTAELLQELNLDPSFSTYSVITKTNLGNAKWSGFELKFMQSLRIMPSLPQWFQGITLWANYTKIAKMEGDFGNPGFKFTELANVVPELYSYGIRFRTPRGRFETNLTTNVQGRKPVQNMLPNTAAGQRYGYQEVYQFWNLDLSYRLNDKLRLTAVARNLMSERALNTEMGIARNTSQATGIAWMFALRYDL